MIDIRWTVSLDCTGGRFSVPDGTPDNEIARLVDEQVQRSIFSRWSPHVADPKDEFVKI
jgi:hypothetical protein